MTNALLQIKNIKKFYGEKKALKGVSFHLDKGEIVSLLGVNGAGKTTLSSIIASLHPPTEGDVEYNGQSIYEHIESYRFKLGFCPQKPNLNNMLTNRQNLIFAGKFYGLDNNSINLRIGQLAEQLELSEYLDKSPRILSGGYKQRFMIARSLIHNPEIVIFDEPTVGLDPHIRRQLWQIIKELKNQNITILITTHYLDEAEKLSDRVCILDNGIIKLIDTPEKLKTDFKEKNLEDLFVKLIDESKK